MAKLKGRPVEQRVRLVEQQLIGRRPWPALRTRLAESQQFALLVGGQDALGCSRHHGVDAEQALQHGLGLLHRPRRSHRIAQHAGPRPSVFLVGSTHEVLLGNRLQCIAAAVQRSRNGRATKRRFDPRCELLGFDDQRARTHGDANGFLRGPHTAQHCALQHGEHARIALEAGHLYRIAGTNFDAWHAQIEHRSLLHAALAKRRQHVADVIEKDLVGAHHKHAITRQLAAVFEQQVRGTVQTNRRLAGARATLHNERLLHWGADHHVLLGLNGGHDFAHRTSARRTNFGEHRIGDTRSRADGIGVVKLLIEIGRDLAVSQCETATMLEPQWVNRSGPVERRCDGSTPVDDHWIVTVIFDVSTTDVPTVVVFVDTTEEVPRTRRT